jgi:cell division initiation protein
MELGAREVHEKQFHDAWRGYNQEEVDDFLDKVAETIDRLTRENRSLHERIRQLDQAVSASKNTEEMLKKTLVTAQRAAEEAIATAKAKAERLIAEAEDRSRQAGEESDRRTAQIERSHIARRRELEESLERLKSYEGELRQRLRGFLEQQLRTLDGLQGRPPGEHRDKPSTAQPSGQQQPQPGTGPVVTAPLEEPSEEAQAQAAAQTRSFSWRPERSK